jgi:hypothetical protein
VASLTETRWEGVREEVGGEGELPKHGGAWLWVGRERAGEAIGREVEHPQGEHTSVEVGRERYGEQVVVGIEDGEGRERGEVGRCTAEQVGEEVGGAEGGSEGGERGEVPRHRAEAEVLEARKADESGSGERPLEAPVGEATSS